MKIADIPARFNVPFANSAGGGYVRTIPEASQVGIQNGAASLETGFPPLNWLPVGAGGVPPFGQDMNGIIRQITQWSRWQGAGNATPYNAAFSSAIGGYPLGSVLSSSTAGIMWLSSVDDNITNPDTGGAGWVRIATSSDVQSGSMTYSAAGGTANAWTATLSPAPSSLTVGMTIRLLLSQDNTGAITLNVNGLGVVPVTRVDGSAFLTGNLSAGIVGLAYTGTSWIVTTPPSPATAADLLSGTSTFKYVTPSLLKDGFRFLEAALTAGTSVPSDTRVTPAIDTPTSNTFVNSTVGPGSQITCGSSDAGVWAVNGFAQYNGVGNNKSVRIYKNGAPSYPSSSEMSVSQNGNGQSNDNFAVSATVRVTTGDVVSMGLLHNMGVTGTVTQGKFSVTRLGS